MPADSQDPTVIRSLAISPTDVVDAFVYTQENPGAAVLRVTPPFHGRMRARLHVYRVDDARVTGAVHLEPAAALGKTVVDDYPDLSPPTEPSPDRDRHTEVVEQWRERALESIRDVTRVETSAGSHEVELVSLG